MIGSLVGGVVKVVQTSNPSLIDTKGVVVNETKKTITILTETGSKRLLRNAVTLEKSHD